MANRRWRERNNENAARGRAILEKGKKAEAGKRLTRIDLQAKSKGERAEEKAGSKGRERVRWRGGSEGLRPVPNTGRLEKTEHKEFHHSYLKGDLGG